jgi:hypothetical protein
MLGQTFNWPRVRAFCLAHVLSKPSTVPFKGALKLLALAPFMYGALVAMFSLDVLDPIDLVEDVMDRWDVRLPAAVYIVAFVCSILLPWFGGHPTYKAPPTTRTIQLGGEQRPRVPEYNSQAKQLVLWSVLEGVFCGVTLWIHLATCLSLFYDCVSQSPWPSAAALTTVGIYLTQVTLNKSFTRQDFTRWERDLLSVLGVAINPLANENGVDLVTVVPTIGDNAFNCHAWEGEVR